MLLARARELMFVRQSLLVFDPVWMAVATRRGRKPNRYVSRTISRKMSVQRLLKFA